MWDWADVINAANLVVGLIVGVLAAVVVKALAIGRWQERIDRRLKNLEFSLASNSRVLNIIVEALTELGGKAQEGAVEFKEFLEAFFRASQRISKDVGQEYFRRQEELSTPNPGYDVEQRKRELWEKSQARTITLEEARELRDLLEEQKKQHESTGDLAGAILAGIMIVAILGIIAYLASRQRSS